MPAGSSACVPSAQSADRPCPTSRTARSASEAPAVTCLAIEPRLAGVVAGLDLDQAHVEPRVAIRVEPQRAGDVNRPDWLASSVAS